MAILTTTFSVDPLRASNDNSPVDREEQKRTRFWLWVLIIIVGACSDRAFCQDPLDYVPNLPYIAQVEQKYLETEPDGTRVRRQKRLVIMRDSQGRARIEVFAEDLNCRSPGGKPDIVNLYVPLQDRSPDM